MLKIINTIPLFSSIPKAELERFIKQGKIHVKEYYKGTTVYDEGETSISFDVVIDGSLAAYTLSENGSTMIMFEFIKGQMLGANLLFGDKKAYPFSIYALDDTKVLHISRQAVASFLHYYPFVMDYVAMLSHNSQKLNVKITMAMHKTLRENLLEYFEQQSLAQQSCVIELPMSKKQLADHLGVQRPSLFRELKKLKEEGMITVNNRIITLHQCSR